MSVTNKAVKAVAIALFCLIVIVLSVSFVLFKRPDPLYAAFRQVGIRSSNRVPEVALAGDIVTLYFELDTAGATSHDLNPAVMIGGRSARVRPFGKGFVACRVLDGADAEGPVSFSIDLVDRPGNSLGRIDSTTDGSGVVVDMTPPFLEEVLVSAANPMHPGSVPAGGMVTVFIRSSEPLGGRPDIVIAGVLPDAVEQLDPTTFRAEAVLSRNLKAGPIPLRIEYADRAGNTGVVFTAGEDSAEAVLIFDPDPPVITGISMASTNPRGKSIAGPGDIIILSFAVSELLATTPVVEIPGAANARLMHIDTLAGLPGAGAGPLYEAVAQLTEPLPPGPVGFTISVTDKAGNTTSVSDKTTDGSSVYFSAPDRKSAPLAAKPGQAGSPAAPQPKTATTLPRLPFIATAYAAPARLGYIDALSPDATMDLTIHFSLSIRRTAPREVAAPVVVQPVEAPAPKPAIAEPAIMPAVARVEAPAEVAVVETPTAAPAVAEPVETPVAERASAAPAQVVVVEAAVEAPAAKPVEVPPAPKPVVARPVETPAVEPARTVEHQAGPPAPAEPVEPPAAAAPVEVAAVETPIKVAPVELAVERVETPLVVERVEAPAPKPAIAEPADAPAETLAVEPARTVEHQVEPPAAAQAPERAVATVEDRPELPAAPRPVAAEPEKPPVQETRRQVREPDQVERVATEERPEPAPQIGAKVDVIIDTPAGGSSFGSHVRVTGRVPDPENVASLTWEVSPLVFLGQQSEFLSGETGPDDLGVFSFIFSTAKLAGSQQVVVTAKYDDGRAGEARISLLEGGSAIPSFSVLSEGETVLVSWDPHPLAESYTVVLEDVSAGIRPEEKTIRNIASPSRIRGLAIGHRYTFTLNAYQRDGAYLGSSSRKEIIVLSPDTLKPTITPEYKRIKVSWPAIAGAGSFVLERAVEGISDFKVLKAVIAGTEYFDTDIAYGRNYLYRVSPEGLSFFSDAAAGEPLAAPEERVRVSISWQEIKVTNATVFGYYTFVAAGEDGLVIFDISDPEKPVNVSSIETSNARDVAVLDRYAYVADSDRGLRVIDIDTPLKPLEAGSRRTSDARSVEVRRIDKENIHAVVADGAYGVKVLDVSNPNNPERIFSIQTTEASDVILTTQGQRVYAVVADGPGGVVIIDLDAPEPTIVSSFQLEYACALSIKGNLLFVADREKGLKVLDLQDIRNPRLLSSYRLDRALGIAVSEDYAYIASDTQGLLIFDVSSPRLPVFYDAVKMEGLSAVAVRGSKVFAGGEKGFHVLDAFTKGESYEIASVYTDGKAYEVSVAGGQENKTYAYVADRAGGLKIFDVTAPGALDEGSLVAHVETEYCMEALAAGNYVYIADGPAGLLIADLSPLWDGDPETRVRIIGRWDTDGNARSVAYANGLIYLADGNRGVKIIDVSIPTRPTQVASIRTEYAVNIKVAGGAIFLADGDGGFRIYDANPNNPRLLSAVDTANTRGVDVKKGIAYVVGSKGMSIIDVTNPAEPTHLGFYPTGYAEEVTVEGRLAFIAEGVNGLTILDVIDPSSPYIVSRGKNRYTVGVAVSGKYAYLVDTTGLRIVEIVIPTWAMRK